MLIFDADYYCSQISTTERSADPYDHYCTIGARRGISPSPYCDVTWYKLTNSDLKDFEGNIVEHFKKFGAVRLVDPHPIFQAGWYQRTYLSAHEVGKINPFEHYITEGWSRGLQPNPLFWSEFYIQEYLQDADGKVDPLLHYIMDGWHTCKVNPLFDPVYYQSNLNVKAGPDPLSHYIHVGSRSGLATHPLFDPAYFLKRSGLSQKDIAETPLQIFLSGEGYQDPHPLFSSDFYSAQLRAHSISVPKGEPAIITYLRRGARDNIDPHSFFQKRFYYKNNPDAVHSDIDALEHYARSEHKENRKFHPLFSPEVYKAQLKDELSVNALQHYLEEGSAKGVRCRKPEPPEQTIRPLPGARVVLDVPNDKTLFNLESLPERKIGAFIHIFYPELTEELLSATNNIPGDCTVYISTDSMVKLQKIRSICDALSEHPSEIRVIPNRGRDIAPMVVGFADRLREVDYGVHLHSKRSRHYAKEFEAWRHYLINNNVGSRELATNILGLLARDEIGAVAPEHFYPIRRLIQWGGNFDMISALLSLSGEEMHRETTLDFPSGSMFWFKTKAIAPLLDLQLTVDHFDPEAGQVDGTLAHAIERAFFYFIAIAGFEYAVINPKPAAHLANGGAELSKLRTVGNRFFVTNRNMGPLRHNYPELTLFTARPSAVKRPRLNLLIPTVDTGMAYAGVATALDVFHAIRKELGPDFDARMLSTDMSPNNQYVPPEGYEIQSLTDTDRTGSDSVTDAARRFHSPIFVRRNDVFLATAWWTAMHAFDIRRQQTQLFGSAPAKIAYLVQDDERGFYAWSTKFALADSTYRQPEATIPIFNTELLFEDFKKSGIYQSGHVLQPGINTVFRDKIKRNTPKEKLVLLYARPHAERNCLPFLDALVAQAVADDPATWDGWHFLAIGENFSAEILSSDRIKVMGRLTLVEYAELASRAALAVSLMVSPHPSYPPLEMAEAGVKVLTNTYGQKDLAELHENIESFTDFNLSAVSAKLSAIATSWKDSPMSGWNGKPRIEWFFGGKSNMEQVARDAAAQIRRTIRHD